MKEIWIATKNKDKIREFKDMLVPLGYEVKSLHDLKEKVDIVEDGKTFEENAIIKAKALYEVLHQEVISDDSGICVDCLDGGPGVYSARFMGEDTSYTIKNNYLIEKANETGIRTARYVCSIAYVNKEGKIQTFTGTCEGEIYDKELGTNGFGYDPVFYYPAFKTTLANVSDEMKHEISHRGKALQLLLEGMK